MGEAKARRDAMRWGTPQDRDMHRCPRCASFRTVVAPGPPMALSHVPTQYGVCAECKTMWEAYPADWKHDVVEATPCDNCAFAKGSPESADREGWLDLISKLKAGGTFNCHKGAPLIIDVEAGSVGFDEAWVQARGRTCAGFVRAMQKWPDWLEKRYGVLGVDDPGSQP